MSNFFRLLFTSSRSWTSVTRTTTGHTIAEVLDETALTAARSGFSGLRLVHGHCPKGGDAIADRWARTRIARGWPVDVERHPADWAGRGRVAGFERNAAMTELGAHACYAFITPCADLKCRRRTPHGSHGATHCVDLAEGAGIHVQRFEPADLLARADAGSLLNPERR